MYIYIYIYLRVYFQFAFEREISQFFAWDYIINRTLQGGLIEDMTFIFSC